MPLRVAGQTTSRCPGDRRWPRHTAGGMVRRWPGQPSDVVALQQVSTRCKWKRHAESWSDADTGQALRKTRQAEEADRQVGVSVAQLVHDGLSQDVGELETMTRQTGHEADVGVVRVAVDNEVFIG